MHPCNHTATVSIIKNNTMQICHSDAGRVGGNFTQQAECHSMSQCVYNSVRNCVRFVCVRYETFEHLSRVTVADATRQIQQSFFTDLGCAGRHRMIYELGHCCNCTLYATCEIWTAGQRLVLREKTSYSTSPHTQDSLLSCHVWEPDVADPVTTSSFSLRGYRHATPCLIHQMWSSWVELAPTQQRHTGDTAIVSRGWVVQISPCLSRQRKLCCFIARKLPFQWN